MPQFSITAPNGIQYKITAPEGATKQEALQRVQQQHQQQGLHTLTPELVSSITAPTATAPIPVPVMHNVENHAHDPNAVSPMGAQGISQVEPGTARDPGFGVKPAKDNSPAEIQRVGDELWSKLPSVTGHPALAAVHYNRGAGNYQRWLDAGAKWETLPKETKDYLGRIFLESKGIKWDKLPETAVQYVGKKWLSTAKQ